MFNHPITNKFIHAIGFNIFALSVVSSAGMAQAVSLPGTGDSNLNSIAPLSSGLVPSYQFQGKGNWSLDGVGGNGTPVGNISAIVPAGSTIEKAFLYSTTFNNSFVPTVNFDGTTYTGGDWTDLGFAATCCNLKAFRTDVTAQVAAAIGGGSASPFTFSVLSEVPNGSIDGEALAIVYSNPLEKERTIAFLDGNTASAGTTTLVNLADPLIIDSNFEAQMSLGIGFSFQQGFDQFSTVDVNGTRLSSAAGGSDDGIADNGGLITIGGIGDSTSNPTNPFANPSSDYSVAPRLDDELYTLTPFLDAGDTQIQIDTTNPSNDDNIFFLGINITAEADICVGPDCGTKVPEPSSFLGLLALGSLGASASLKRKLTASKFTKKQ